MIRVEQLRVARLPFIGSDVILEAETGCPMDATRETANSVAEVNRTVAFAFLRKLGCQLTVRGN